MSTHTPKRLEYHNSGLIDCLFDPDLPLGDSRIAEMIGSHGADWAAHIVRCVNSHQALVDALRAILFQICQGKVLERDACITQARAALKAAGEEL